MELKQYEEYIKKKKTQRNKRETPQRKDDSWDLSMKMLSLKSVHKRFIIKQSEKI